jgi:hypothetical protein
MAEKRRWGPSLGAWASAREYTAQRTSILIPNGQYRVLLSPTSPSRLTLGPPVAIGAVGPGGVVSQDRDFVIELDGRPGSYRLHVSSPAKMLRVPVCRGLQSAVWRR